MTPQSRQIRIFISSTFRDMQAERDYLITKVFPRLKAEAAKRDVSLIPLDLRWGVTEQESKTGKVIEICLDEIQNSRPFFIGLVGNRYGWVPDQSELRKNQRLTEQYGWLTDDINAGLSVTEIEMQYGVLRAKDDINAYFFLKEGGEDDSDKLGRLRKNIRDNKRYPVYDYSSVEQLGEQVERDFMKLLDELYPIGELSKLEADRQVQRSFISSRSEVYVPNEAHYRALDEWLGGEEQYLVVTGESGMGKSALIANWISSKTWGEDTEIIYHFIGNGGEDGNSDNILQRIVREVCDLYTLPLPEQGKGDSKQQAENALRQIEGKKPLLIVLDAVNQLQEAGNQKQLTWLPQVPQNVRVLFSTLKDDTTMRVFERLKYPLFELQPLDKQQRRELATTYLARFSKHLTDKQIDRIVKSPVVRNTLVMRTLLDELIGFGSHEELDGRIGMYLEAKDTPDFFRIVLERYEADFGAELISHLFSLIAFSRNGMAEDELMRATGINQLQYSQIYCAFRQNMMVRGGLNCLNHQHITTAIKNRYADRRVKTQQEICALLQDEKTHRAWDELPWQYMSLQEYDKLYKFLLDEDVFYYLARNAYYDLGLYWRTLQQADKKKYAFTVYLDLIKSDTEDDAVMSRWYGGFALRMIEDSDIALQFFTRAAKIAEQLYGTDSLDTATAYDYIANAYMQKAKPEQALDYYTRALDIRRKLQKEDTEEIAHSYSLIGILYDETGKKQRAAEELERALSIYRKVEGENGDGVASTLMRLGHVYGSLRQDERALEYNQQALRLYLTKEGENSTSVSSMYNLIGDHYLMTQRNGEEALKYYKKALEIDCRLLGEEHTKIGTDYSQIGSAYLLMHDQQKAIDCFERSLKIRVNVYGEMHPTTASGYQQIGSAYGIFKQWKKALPYYEKALNICQQTYGEEYTGTASLHGAVGMCLMNTKRYEEALQHFKACYQTQKTLLGENHPYTQNALGRIQTAETMLHFKRGMSNLKELFKIIFRKIFRRE